MEKNKLVMTQDNNPANHVKRGKNKGD